MWTLTQEEEFPLMYSLQGEFPTRFWILARGWRSCSCPAMAFAWPTWEMSNGNHFWLLSKPAKNNKQLYQLTRGRTPLPEDMKTWKLWGQIKWIPPMTSLLLPGNSSIFRNKSHRVNTTLATVAPLLIENWHSWESLKKMGEKINTCETSALGGKGKITRMGYL